INEGAWYVFILKRDSVVCCTCCRICGVYPEVVIICRKSDVILNLYSLRLRDCCIVVVVGRELLIRKVLNQNIPVAFADAEIVECKTLDITCAVTYKRNPEENFRFVFNIVELVPSLHPSVSANVSPELSRPAYL